MKKNTVSLALALSLFWGCVSYNQKNIPITPLNALPKIKTSAHYTLEMERDLGANDGDFRKIDAFLDSVERRAEPKLNYNKEDAEKILKIINEESRKLFFSTYEKGNIFYISLRTGKADCERYAIPFMSAAERLNLPLIAIFAQGGKRIVSNVETNTESHVFVRWKIEDSSQKWINCECENGRLMSDDYYKDYNSLTEISNFRDWCIKTRLEWCAKSYSTNYSSAIIKSKELRRITR